MEDDFLGRCPKITIKLFENITKIIESFKGEFIGNPRGNLECGSALFLLVWIVKIGQTKMIKVNKQSRPFNH